MSLQFSSTTTRIDLHSILNNFLQKWTSCEVAMALQNSSFSFTKSNSAICNIVELESSSRWFRAINGYHQFCTCLRHNICLSYSLAVPPPTSFVNHIKYLSFIC